MLKSMHANRLMPILLTVACLLVDLCAVRIATGHHWPEIPFVFVLALFSSQLALLVAAAVFYRGQAVLRIAAVVCLAAVWCHWGATLTGDPRHWAALATITAFPIAGVLLVARGLIARHVRSSILENPTSSASFGVGEMLAATAVAGMVFACVRMEIDTPLDRPALSVAGVSAAMSVLFVLVLLCTRLTFFHVLALVPLTLLGGMALATASTESLRVCVAWAALHGALLTGALLVLRSAGLRFHTNTQEVPAIEAANQYPSDKPVSFDRTLDASC